MATTRNKKKIAPVASAAPAAPTAAPAPQPGGELSEFEYGLIVSGNAFSRWVIHCMAAAGLRELTPLDVLVLQHVNHRARDKRLADICFIMNVEDTHLVNYSLKKLVALEVVQSRRSGKDVTYSTTALGQQRCERYREVREACLVAAMQTDPAFQTQIGMLARLMRILSGMYDQAARSAASL